jgi:hypothetical protein
MCERFPCLRCLLAVLLFLNVLLFCFVFYLNFHRHDTHFSQSPTTKPPLSMASCTVISFSYMRSNIEILRIIQL